MWEIKSQSRWLSIASGKVNFETRSNVPITMILTRGTYLEHVFTNWVQLDPTNVTDTILTWIINQQWYSDDFIQGIWTHGSTIAGFGILRLEILRGKLGTKLISIIDEVPRSNQIKKTLLSNFQDGNKRWEEFQENKVIPESIKDLNPKCNLWLACYGLNLKEGVQQLNNQQIQGCLPEGLRMAQKIAKNTYHS